MTAHLPDAAPTNWVDRHAPTCLQPWLRLGRFDRPTGIWLLMLPGWQGIALAAAQHRQPPPLPLLLLFFLGAALMRAAGCAYNDIVDRDIDAKVARTAGRPIPAGQITVPQASIFIALCLLVSATILLFLNWEVTFLAVASLLLVAAYPFMKRITWWPQVWLGLTFNWGALMGHLAASPGATQLQIQIAQHTPGALVPLEVFYNYQSLPALLLYASGIFWTLGYDTIYAVQDLEDDALAGVKSSARRLGAAAPKAVLLFYVASFVLVLAAAFAGGLGPLFLPPAVIFGMMLARQAQRLRLNDPASALALFKSNTWAGLVLFIAFIAGLWRP
ncbi:MAG: UbiA family prenyltransferase [Parcubacteria group bacterium]